MFDHGSDGATALFDMDGFVVSAQMLEDGEWWLSVETTADRGWLSGMWGAGGRSRPPACAGA